MQVASIPKLEKGRKEILLQNFCIIQLLVAKTKYLKPITFCRKEVYFDSWFWRFTIHGQAGSIGLTSANGILAGRIPR